MNHLKEPYRHVNCIKEIEKDKWGVIQCEDYSFDVTFPPIVSFSAAEETRSRIISCVNACAGIENPEDLRKQRDELMETMIHIAEYWNRDANETAMLNALWNIIAEAEEIVERFSVKK